MSARRVTAEIKAQIHPILHDWDFDDIAAKTATRVRGPVTVAVEIRTFSAASARKLQVPPGSFDATTGINYGSATGTEYTPRSEQPVSCDQTSLRAFLSRTSALGGDVRPDVWPVASDHEAEAAVADLARAFHTQAEEFIAGWSDPAEAHRRLLEIGPMHHDGAIDQAGYMFPGNPGSINRLTHLIVTAELAGDIEAEIAHLQAMLEKSPLDERARKRLTTLTQVH